MQALLPRQDKKKFLNQYTASIQLLVLALLKRNNEINRAKKQNGDGGMNYQVVCNECKIQTLPRGTELPSALMAFELEELQCFVTDLPES